MLTSPKSLLRGLVLAASVAVALAACSTGTPDTPVVPSTAPATSAAASEAAQTTEPEPWYPAVKQVGAIPLDEKDGKLVCLPDDGTTVLKIGGKVDYNGEIISATHDGEPVYVSFEDGENDTKEYGIVNDTVPFTLTLEDDETPPDGIVFEPENLDVKSVDKIVLCGGGL